MVVRILLLLGTVVYIFNPNTLEERQADLSEFDASLVYIMISKTARDTK